MHRVPLISTSPKLHAEVQRAVSGCHFEPPEMPLLDDPRQAMEFLNVELPELVCLHFAGDGSEAEAMLDAITRDPWLLRAGIVPLCDDEETIERLENLRDANVVAALSVDGMQGHLPRLLDIVRNNRRILFQREIGSSLLRRISGQFTLHNDHLEARCYTNLICSFLFHANRIDGSTRDALSLAMTEMLANAIEHGNCGISYEEKSAWLGKQRSMNELIEQRCRDPQIAGRRVTLEYTIDNDTSQFLIADEGAGFDWRGLQDATGADALLRSHGRGILMTRAVTQQLTYNELGNEARFEIAHQQDEANLTPGMLMGMEPRDVQPGETIFRQGDTGDFLYYVAKGRYDVIVEGKQVARLTPDDIFMGEMSFLLNDRRTATVTACTEGRLIEISRKDFVEAIKEQPHYALLLSRLMAQRVRQANRLQAQL